MDNILVSVIIPTYSRNVTLTRAIDSVLKQTHKNFEVIVVDDNPPESSWRKSTEEIMSSYEQDRRVRYIQNVQNCGGAVARNNGILTARGDYIAFLDDDDEYFPTKLEKQLNCFIKTEHKKLALVFCDAVMTYDNDKFVCNVTPRYDGCCIYEAMRDNCLAATSQWMAKKEALLDVGMFSNVPCKQDSTLILKLLVNGYEVECVPEILSKYCNYAGERISSTGIKNLNGELAYKSLCENYYEKLTKEEIEEVEYSFSKKLYELYSANGMENEGKSCLHAMLKKHLLSTICFLGKNRWWKLKNTFFSRG